MKPRKWWLATAIIVFLAIPGTSAWAETLDANSIGNLTNDKTWQMKWPTCLGYNCTQFWDWRQDGSICARMFGNDRQEKCADDGRWRLQGGNLCWDLEWMGGEMQKGRYLHCPNGSHMALYDDQQVYFQGLIQFVQEVDAGRF